MKKLYAIKLSLAVGLLLVLTSFTITALSANWPQWRGTGTGVSEEKNLPTAWNTSQGIKWKTPIAGRGHSSPVVWGNKIFLTTAIEGEAVPGAKAVTHVVENGKEFLHPDSVGADRKHAFKVIAVNADTGKILWQQTAWEGTPYDNRHRKSSYAASTPATDGKMVFAFFGTEAVIAYDPATGKELWKHKGVESNAIPSPVANREMVFVSAGFPAKIVMAIQLGGSG
ncbi:MAG: outer membrane protein assembly factor BamB family protein, partial [Pyrinomonadaceae bacterium]